MSTNYSKIIEALEEDNARLAAEVKRLRGALQNIIDECSWGGRKGTRTNDMLDRGRAALSAAPAPQPITNLDSIGNELVALAFLRARKSSRRFGRAQEGGQTMTLQQSARNLVNVIANIPLSTMLLPLTKAQQMAVTTALDALLTSLDEVEHPKPVDEIAVRHASVNAALKEDSR